jgi:hypothetical protein
MYPDKFGDLFRAFRRNIWGGIVTLPLWRVLFIVLWVVYFVLAPYFMIQSFFNTEGWLTFDFSIGIVVNSAAYFAYALSIWLYWRKRGMGKWYYYVLFPFIMFLDFIIILVSLFYGFQGRKVSWKGRFYSTKGSSFKKQKKEKMKVERKETIDKEIVIKQ